MLGLGRYLNARQGRGPMGEADEWGGDTGAIGEAHWASAMPRMAVSHPAPPQLLHSDAQHTLRFTEDASRESEPHWHSASPVMLLHGVGGALGGGGGKIDCGGGGLGAYLATKGVMGGMSEAAELEASAMMTHSTQTTAQPTLPKQLNL